MNYETAALADMISKNRMILNVEDADPIMVVRYIGEEASGTLTVVAGAEEFVFQHGDLASEAADTTIDVGSTPGSIDVSDGDGDTLGKVVDVINASANWEARLIGGLRSDSLDSGGLSHVAIGESQAKTTAGIVIKADTTVDDVMTAGAFEGAWNAKIGGNAFISDKNVRYSLLNVFSNIAHGGAGLISIYLCDEIAKTETLVAQWAGAATGVEQDKDILLGEGGLTAIPGKIIKVRVAATAMTTGTFQTSFKVAEY